MMDCILERKFGEAWTSPFPAFNSSRLLRPQTPQTRDAENLLLSPDIQRSTMDLGLPRMENLQNRFSKRSSVINVLG